MSSSPCENDASIRVLGICGGIGSGKSTASKFLVSSCNCFEHIDADTVAHSIYAPGSQAIKDVVATFGKGILIDAEEGQPMEIDRKKLGAIVFADRSEMAKLEEIVWPHVKVLLAEKIEQLKKDWVSAQDASKRPIVVLEAAILLDAGWDDMLDGIWAVTVQRETALARLMESRGLTSEEATKRIDAQESRRGIGNIETEVENGTITGVIVNDGSLDDLQGSLEKSLDDPNCWRASP